VAVSSERRTRDQTVDDDRPRRGRPRSEKARAAILKAAVELLLERGLGEVSMDAIAEHAGVSKATIYRRWRSKELLALDALYHDWDTSPSPIPDTGSARGDLIAVLRPWIRRARSRPYGRVLAALLIAADADPEFRKEYLARFVEPRRRVGRLVMQRAIERGDLPPTANVDVALDLLYGALYHRLLHGHGPLNDRFVSDVVDLCLVGVASPHGPGQDRSSGVSRARR
jgi:AcrR family transcriptional regulator